MGVDVGITMTGFTVRSGRGRGVSLGAMEYTMGVGVTVLGVTGVSVGSAVAVGATVSNNGDAVADVPQARAAKIITATTGALITIRADIPISITR
ncbi:MAG: hypothetical protein BZY81_03350 [SAR202 cluster bacterium Io17-Chloro-G4]|nr:MAG: hypothetical protein BZY81_03350 [SAR202 cluster bacterium Io17-Chloro-G4]